MFQANGDWYIMPLNDMASTIYYTKYTVSDTPSVISFGTLDNIIDIEPYSDGNVHFINNSQVKIVRKGYQVVESNTPFTYVKNMAKWQAASKWCNDQGIQFRVLNEHDIF